MKTRGELLLWDLAKLHEIERREATIDADNAAVMYGITRGGRWKRLHAIGKWEAARQAAISTDILRRLKRLQGKSHA